MLGRIVLGILLSVLLLAALVPVLLGLYAWRLARSSAMMTRRLVPVEGFTERPPLRAAVGGTLFRKTRDKATVPESVTTNAARFCPDLQQAILDDTDALSYLKWFDRAYRFDDGTKLSTTDRFRTLKQGAHRADLLRYALLFHFGGLYLDIKTRFRAPFRPSRGFGKGKQKREGGEAPFLYACIGADLHWLHRFTNLSHNGVIGCTPNHPVLAECIHQCLVTPDPVVDMHYLAFCHFLGYAIARRYFDGGYLRPGVSADGCLELAVETVSRTNFAPCGGVPDRHGFCAIIEDANGSPVFLGRDPKYTASGYLAVPPILDFPWLLPPRT
jgi:hypothetical protein